STCWTTRGGMVGVGRKSCPQVGQVSRRWSKDPALRASGGNAARSCLGWPGCPPIRRLSCPSGGGGFGGLPMAEDGGLGGGGGSLGAAASCWPSRATTCRRAASSASRASTRVWSRQQLEQWAVSLALMPLDHTHSAAWALHR